MAGSAAHPLTGFFETADAVESARNSGFWGITGGANTADGTHPSTLGHTRMAAVCNLAAI